jgi:hypothetical protein
MKNLINYFILLVIDGPKEFWQDAVEYIRNKMDRHKIRRTIEECREYTQIDKRHRYVVRGVDGRPIGVTSSQIEKLKREGKLPKHINCVSIYNNSLEIVKYQPGFSNREGSGRKIKSI